MWSESCKVVPYVEDKREEANTWTAHWHLPNFLQKPGSYESQLFDGTWRCLDCLYSFDMPPTSYKEYMLDKCQSIMYKVEVGILGMEYHFVGTLPWFYKVHPLFITCWFDRRSFQNQMQWKRIKMVFLQPMSLLANCRLHHFNATISNYSIIWVNIELCLIRWKNMYKKYDSWENV